MFADVMTGIALVKQSVDFIKSNIDTVSDIRGLTDQIEGIFQGEEQIQKKRAKRKGLGVRDQLGIKNVAQEVIDAKIAQEAMNEMRTMIDFRFGHGTWQSIVDLRASRIKEEREAAEAERQKSLRADREFNEMMKTGLIVFCVVTLMVVAFGWVIMQASASVMQ